MISYIHITYYILYTPTEKNYLPCIIHSSHQFIFFTFSSREGIIRLFYKYVIPKSPLNLDPGVVQVTHSYLFCEVLLEST